MSAQIIIKSIKIENVRGISTSTFIFDTPEMFGNKFHLLVAPNGFGKSSFAGAFASLKPRSLKLPQALLHKDDEANKPKLEITYSVGGVEKTVKADENCNDIAREFSVSVINSRLKPRAVAKTGFNQFAKPTASLIIEPVILVERVPKKPTKTFSTSDFKKDFGGNGKILPNIQQFLDDGPLLNRFLALPEISRFSQRRVWKQIDPVVAEINAQAGNASQLLDWVERNKLPGLQAIPELAAVASLLSESSSLNEVERFLVAYQLAKAYSEDARTLNNHRDWRLYLSGKQRCKELLNSVISNPAWINVSIEETKGQLIAEFPIATRMSNGQRDLLSFIAQLMRAEFELVEEKAILIVDEVFDYLDECNLLAAQYYVSKFIDRFKSGGAQIFPLFLTHLNPEVFKHSILGLGKGEARKVHFLDKASDTSRRVGIAVMVQKRDESALRDYIGKHYFHYHPQDCDQTGLFRTHGLKETWGKSHDFYRYVFEEFRKYLSGASDADFVAACVAARIAIEKHAFDQLTPADQVRFTDEFAKGTVNKLDFVEQSCGTDVPEVHRLLGLLYNDMLHHKPNFDYISVVVSKMKNPAIRGMMSELPIPAGY